MARLPVDLSAHLNADIVCGNPADFSVTLEPVHFDGLGGRQDIPARRAVVRQDTGRAIAVVSNRYALVPHTRILEVIEEAIAPLDVGPVPRGIYVDRGGAQMRALFKFPALALPIVEPDIICPCIQVRNTYDGSARIGIHIGAFRFVCTNLAVGGGGAFAAGFLSIHTGEILVERMAAELADYLGRFDRIVRLYRQWSQEQMRPEDLDAILKHCLRGRFAELTAAMLAAPSVTAFDAYNRLTDHATHRMRSARTAFEMLERVNASFQRLYPVRDV